MMVMVRSENRVEYGHLIYMNYFLFRGSSAVPLKLPKVVAKTSDTRISMKNLERMDLPAN